MGFLDDLLGGEAPSLETRSLSTIDPTQRESLNRLIAQLSGRAPRDASSYVAPLGSGEMTSLAALEERSRALAVPSANLDAAGGSLRSQLDFAGQTADASEYFRTNVQNPLLDSFSREILPQISRSFGGADFFSSERQNAEGLARQDLLNTLAGQKTAVELDQFNKSRERALTAAGLIPGIEQAEAGRTQQLTDILTAQALPRNIEQAGLDRQLADQTAQEQLLAQLGLTPTIENIGMTNPGSAGIVNLLLGGAASGLGGIIGEEGGGSFIEWLRNLFGSSSGNPDAENPSGDSPADNMPPPGTGTVIVPPPVGSTPGGSTVITEGESGTLANQQGQTVTPDTGINIGPSNAGLAGAIAGAGGLASILGSAATPAGTAIITEGAGTLASQVGAASTSGAVGGAAAGGGAATGAAAGSGAGVGAAGYLSGFAQVAPLAAAGFFVADLLNQAIGTGSKIPLWKAFESVIPQLGMHLANVGRAGQFLRLPTGEWVRYGNATTAGLRDAVIAQDQATYESELSRLRNERPPPSSLLRQLEDHYRRYGGG